MSNSFKRNIVIGTLAIVAGPALAQQPPDSVASDTWNNTAMGANALLNQSAGYSPKAHDNTAAGASTLISNTEGAANTAVGSNTLTFNTTGNQNTATGWGALYRNTTGYNNSAHGVSALNSNTSGAGNTANGYAALYLNTTGYSNTASGTEALESNTTGAQNAANGALALGFNQTGSGNTADGYEALSANTTGSNNTGVGYGSLSSNVSGNLNIALGLLAGENITGSENIDIGNPGVAADNGYIRIGVKGTQKAAFIAGIYSTTLEPNSLPVFVNAAGRLSVGTSSERYKTGIATMGSNTDKLRQLRPVTFHLRTDPKGALQYGLIAEEVAKIYPELVIHDETGKVHGVRYDELAPLLLNEVQRQQRQLDDLRQQVAEFKQLSQSTQAALSKLLAVDQKVAMR